MNCLFAKSFVILIFFFFLYFADFFFVFGLFPSRCQVSSSLLCLELLGSKEGVEEPRARISATWVDVWSTFVEDRAMRSPGTKRPVKVKKMETRNKINSKPQKEKHRRKRMYDTYKHTYSSHAESISLALLLAVSVSLMVTRFVDSPRWVEIVRAG